MNTQKLSDHLKSLCQDQPEYANLQATWLLNKHTCSDALKSVVINYPHFSMHDASHAEAVISKMEMLLGERIHTLSPTDTWLLLHAAYTHDLGMILSWEQIQILWKTSEFQEFLSSIVNARDRELREAVKFIQDENYRNGSLWPLKAHRYVSLINAQYFRNHHAQLSNIYIQTANSVPNIDLGHNGLIQPRILKMLGEVCELHTAPLSKVLTLDYQTDGVGSDYAHPRFVVMLLRLGDLLDIDNGRFNTVLESTFGGLPESSVPHKEKHEATTHLLVTPREIQFRSDCPNSQAYLETRNFVVWLEEEVDFLTKHWAEIAPQELGGYAPRFDKKELLINGTPDIEGVAGLRFEISQEKAFQIIEGSNIYEDRFVFVRELIQNAMDASKVQLWRDLTSGNYRAWLGDKNLAELQPYDIDRKIYESYPITVRLSTLQDGTTQVTISDRGTGISTDVFKQMCNVGASKSGSKQMRTEVESMPKWLRPTAGFGVGLQSIFLVADQFKIITGTGTESYVAIVHANRLGGHLQLQKAQDTNLRGTTIQVCFKMPDNYTFSMFGETDTYLEYHYDPMENLNRAGEARVLEAIRKNCEESLFPLHVKCKESSLPQYDQEDLLPICRADDVANWACIKDRYKVSLSKECDRFRVWDMEHAVYGDFCMHPTEGWFSEQYSFKGISINKRTPSLRYKGFSVLLDMYGQDTREMITLDRDSLTRVGLEKTTGFLGDLFNLYIECALKQLKEYSVDQRKEVCQSEKFAPYTFWRACNLAQRKLVPADVIAEIEGAATVIEKSETGIFHAQARQLRELIPEIEKMHFANAEENVATQYENIRFSEDDHFEICAGKDVESGKSYRAALVCGSTLRPMRGRHVCSTVRGNPHTVALEQAIRTAQAGKQGKKESSWDRLYMKMKNRNAQRWHSTNH